MERPQLYVLSAIQIFAVGLLVWILITRPTPWNFERYVGTALVIVGAGFIALARYQLGGSFSIRPEAHKLVTRGLYSKIRNPIYVFGTLLFAGVILIVQRPILWLFLAAIVVMQTVRARREARVLEAAFGEAYREYRRKTWL